MVAVMADMIEGVILANNDLPQTELSAVRDELWIVASEILDSAMSQPTGGIASAEPKFDARAA